MYILFYDCEDKTRRTIRDWIYSVETSDYETLELTYKTELFSFTEDDIGKTIFFSKEEAEQALKERENQ